MDRIDGRKSRNEELFKEVHETLVEAGVNRTVDQIKTRWKALKTLYYRAKANNSKSGSAPTSFPFFAQMDDFMGDRPLANFDRHSVDIGFGSTGTSTSAEENSMGEFKVNCYVT